MFDTKKILNWQFIIVLYKGECSDEQPGEIKTCTEPYNHGCLITKSDHDDDYDEHHRFYHHVYHDHGHRNHLEISSLKVVILMIIISFIIITSWVYYHKR